MGQLKIEGKEIRGVLFDFDGVIGHTIDDNFAAWHAAFSVYGVAVDFDSYAMQEGLSPDNIARFFCKMLAVDLIHIPTIVAAKVAHYQRHNNFRLEVGALATLDWLAENGVSSALATGAGRNRVISTLASAGLEDTFGNEGERLVAAEDVSLHKPNPDPYLKAAALLGLSPSECIVVENAPLGIKAGLTAGCYTVGLTTTLPAVKLAGANMVLGSQVDLLVFFKANFK